jgi:hypothetical protein
MARNTKTYRRKIARARRAQQGSEPQSEPRDEAQDELMEDIGDDFLDMNGDSTTYIDNLPNELLNAITDLAIASGTPVATLRLVSKRLRACAQSSLIERLQEKLCRTSTGKKPQLTSITIRSGICAALMIFAPWEK